MARRSTPEHLREAHRSALRYTFTDRGCQLEGVDRAIGAWEADAEGRGVDPYSDMLDAERRTFVEARLRADS